MTAAIGDEVAWTNSRKALGIVVHLFNHRGVRYAVVDTHDERKGLIVVRLYDRLVNLSRQEVAR